MAKIDLFEPVYAPSGVICYAGFVNDTYTHFLGYDVLTKKEIKQHLLDRYKETHIQICGREMR